MNFQFNCVNFLIFKKKVKFSHFQSQYYFTKLKDNFKLHFIIFKNFFLRFIILKR